MNIRKTILIASLALMVSAAAPTKAADMQQSDLAQPVEVVEENIIVEEISSVGTPQENQIPESKIARKMTQAEKNQNAAENDSWGGAITIIAMCIVLAALIVLSILFMIFGKVSETLLTSKKKKAKQNAEHEDDNHDLAPGEVIAAISLALSEHFGDGHDVEDTILTIRRMQKAYSPWNSKIYNLRITQDHRRNPLTEIKFNESKRIQV